MVKKKAKVIHNEAVASNRQGMQYCSAVFGDQVKTGKRKAIRKTVRY
jgi:hypothetical protein